MSNENRRLLAEQVYIQKDYAGRCTRVGLFHADRVHYDVLFQSPPLPPVLPDNVIPTLERVAATYRALLDARRSDDDPYADLMLYEELEVLEAIVNGTKPVRPPPPG